MSRPARPLAAAAALGAALGAVLAGATARVTAAAPPAAKPLAVVASFYPLAEWAGTVGGARVAVTNLTPAGGEPHDFEPKPADLRRMREADVVVTLGPGFQPALDRALRGAPGRQVRFVVTEGLSLRDAEPDGHDHGAGPAAKRTPGDRHHADPHVWLDPALAKQIVLGIAGALARADPGGRAAYEAAGREYAAKLDALHARYEQTLSSCERRDLVTSHAAFGYLASRYRLEQEAIRGVSPEAEPTPRRLAELVAFVRKHGVKYVFTETTVSPKVAETLAREAGAKTLVLHTLESLSDAELAQGKTYLTVMEENLRALATGLECQGS
jgi:zinc transport system substrate-binding protein